MVRYMELRDQVRKLLNQYPQIECVGVESPPFGELWSEGLYALFVYTNETLYLCRKDVIYFDPATVKMLAKGDPKARKGKMFKTDMVMAARADTGIKGPFNHNEADAYLIAKFAARFWLLYHGKLELGELTPSEYHAFAEIHTFVRGQRKGETVKVGALFKENRRFFCFSRLETPNESCSKEED